MTRKQWIKNWRAIAKLKEVDLNKTRLEREIDSLPADAKYRERKLHDMTLRLDSLYDVIVELEEKIEDARLRRDAIKQQAITLENIYKIMVNFDCVYNIINDEEKRNVVTALIKEIEIYRNDESEYPLKRIGLNFPVFKDGGEVTELLWDKGNTVDDLDIMTLRSTDAGVAFYVASNGVSLFHAGDLNDWEWDGAGDLINGRVRRAFSHEIKKLSEKPINVAFSRWIQSLWSISSRVLIIFYKIPRQSLFSLCICGRTTAVSLNTRRDSAIRTRLTGLLRLNVKIRRLLLERTIELFHKFIYNKLVQ